MQRVARTLCIFRIRRALTRPQAKKPYLRTRNSPACMDLDPWRYRIFPYDANRFDYFLVHTQVALPRSTEGF